MQEPTVDMVILLSIFTGLIKVQSVGICTNRFNRTGRGTRELTDGMR
jgi:hypothetical protein